LILNKYRHHFFKRKTRLYDLLRNTLNNIEWDNFFTNENVDYITDKITNTILNVVTN